MGIFTIVPRYTPLWGPGCNCACNLQLRVQATAYARVSMRKHSTALGCNATSIHPSDMRRRRGAGTARSWRCLVSAAALAVSLCTALVLLSNQTHIQAELTSAAVHTHAAVARPDHLPAARAVPIVRTMSRGSVGQGYVLTHTLQQWLFMPSQRLAFCWIQKVGCSSFKKLFDKAVPRADWDRVRQAHRSVQAIFNDPTWHKAVFYREPLARFASGWLDKCQGGVTRLYCVHVFGGQNVSFRRAVLSLSEGCQQEMMPPRPPSPPPRPPHRTRPADTASDETDHDADDLDARLARRSHLLRGACLSRKGKVGDEHHQMDGHFRQQSDFCGGLGASLGGYDTIQPLTSSTSRERVGQMVRCARPGTRLCHARSHSPAHRPRSRDLYCCAMAACQSQRESALERI